MKRNLVTAFAAIAGSQVAILIVQAAFSPLLVRILGVTTYGEYATLTSAFGLLTILVSSGINGGVRKYISEEREGSNWKNHVFAYYFRLALILALIAAGALVFAAEFGLVGTILQPKYNPYFFLLALLVVASQFREYVRRALMGLKLEHLGEPLNVIYQVSFSVTAIALAALEFGVAGVLVGQIFASMLVFVIAIVFISKHISLGMIFRPVPKDFPRKELFYFNHNTVIYIFLLTSMYHIDVLMLGALTNSELTGYYRAALVLVQFLWLLPRSLQSLMIQSTSDHWAKGRIKMIEDIATRATRYVLLLILLLAIGLGALAPVFVPMYYGVDMKPAIVPLLILLPGTVGFAVARPLLTINHAKGDMGVLIAATGAAAVLNLAFNYTLIPHYGMAGAALSTTIGYGSLPLFQVWGARMLGYNPFKRARLGRISATAILSASVIGIMSVTIGSTTVADVGVPWLGIIGETPIAMLIVPPAGFLLYSLIAIATGAIDLGEVFEILVKIPGPVGSVAQPLKQSFEASEQFGNQQSRSSAIKLILALAAVIVLVSGAVMAAGFPLLAMTPLGSAEDGVLGSIVDQGPPSSTPAPNGTNYNTTVGLSPQPTDTPQATPTATPSQTAVPTPTPTPTPTPHNTTTSTTTTTTTTNTTPVTPISPTTTPAGSPTTTTTPAGSPTTTTTTPAESPTTTTTVVPTTTTTDEGLLSMGSNASAERSRKY
ncbi:oligosaccharide flippase family protein [Halocatena marina]|uniref:Oligosaccharide flippase family protein n=2 Tax=Halocatena marina TaxID=2934937 RepID=A0ABD5YRT2_9EURY|nr:oligosaccharide flippase family protein [Halocatena marina]